MNKFEEICKAIEAIIDSKIKKVTKVLFCIVISLNGNKCTISLNSKQYTVNYYGNTPAVGKKYPIVIPDGDMSQAFVIG